MMKKRRHNHIRTVVQELRMKVLLDRLVQKQTTKLLVGLEVDL